jgi:WD40 repeat protein
MGGYAAKVRQLAWDPSGRLLATGGGETIIVWDCKPPGPENTAPLELVGHKGLVSELAYQARGPVLASGGQDGKVLLWQPGSFKKALATSDAGSPPMQVVWSPDDRALAVGTEAGQVAVYSIL